MDESQGDGTSENRRRGTGKPCTSNHFVEMGVTSDVLAQPSTPCGACKFLRRKCINGCIFALHFSSDQGAARFAAVHKVFGASNVSKLLLHITANRRHDAVITISYEAQARLSDPIYGCVSTIVVLQQQVQSLEAELCVMRNQLINSRFSVASALQNSQHIETLQPAYSNTSSVSHNFISMSNFSPNFGENTIAPNSNNFEQNIHNLYHHVQDEENEESDDDPAVAFVNHIFH